jgi:hypothetical protein
MCSTLAIGGLGVEIDREHGVVSGVTGLWTLMKLRVGRIGKTSMMRLDLFLHY